MRRQDLLSKTLAAHKLMAPPKPLRAICEASSSSESSDEVSQDEPDECAAEPEFPGLWDHKYELPPQQTTVPFFAEDKPAVTKKVCGGKMKGPPFASKPEVIVFKDFDLGKSYKKKVILKNISYITNQCKLEGVFGQMRDFISINFDPPGPLSTGKSCRMVAIFKPKINKNLEGEVRFSSALGPFSVPVRCTIKKCELKVDSQFVDFGSHVVGQILTRSVTLTNSGALASLFRLDTSTGVPVESDTTPDEIPADNCDISLGNVREGEIGPFESIKLQIFFTPTIPGEEQLDFKIEFSDPNCIPIPVKVRGLAISLPVWVVQPSVDLKICMYDSLYQEMILIQSRASTVLTLTFDMCEEMKKHMEILPKTGFIQAQSSFDAHLKFLPRPSLSEDAEKYFDKETGVLEVPMTVRVAGQVKPIRFTVQAVVTTSDLKFDHTELDFGYCSTYQSLKSTVQLTNLSLLSQEFGFLNIPEFIDIQPNDGFGIILPQETLKIDLIFSAKKAKEYNFQLTCKSIMNREFRLSCRAVGVHPPLELSHSLVLFGATAVGDKSTALLYLSNLYSCSKQPLSSEAREALKTATPRLFSFTPPENSDIRISPSAGRLLPGERCLLQVTFSPKLSEQDIKDTFQRLLLQAKPHIDTELEKTKPVEPEIKKVIQPESKKAPKSSNSKTTKMPEPVKPETIHESPKSVAKVPRNTELLEEARLSLLTSFTQHCSEYTVPCIVSDGDPPVEDRTAQPAWKSHNTLFLRLQCPAVRPSLVVVSNESHNVVDFHLVAVGEKKIKRLTVKNISTEPLELGSSLLDLYGPFSILNALREIGPGEELTLILAFSPAVENKYSETLEIRCKTMTLEVTLLGNGVNHAVSCSRPGGTLDYGYVLEKESLSQALKLKNTSTVTVGFKVLLASLATCSKQVEVDKVACLLDTQIEPIVGTQNYSGCSVFTVIPMEGTIEPGEGQDVIITFQPDHPCANYSDRLVIELSNGSKLCEIKLKGAASENNMYIQGADRLTVPVESLVSPEILFSPLQLRGTEMTEKHIILVKLLASFSDGAITPARRELRVGCIKSTQTKKSGEFSWDNVAAIQQHGFSIHPLRSTVEAGSSVLITLSWTPQTGYKPNDVVQMCVSLTVKGEETNVYNVTLMALVSAH
ncbi:cilia- and flagella-associated protein 74 isoform 1-T1 [Synchiropus picturatus]